MKCPKGHTYRSELTDCPICKQVPSNIGETAVLSDSGNHNTEIFPEFTGDDGNKTIVIGSNNRPQRATSPKVASRPIAPGTMYGGEFDPDAEPESEAGTPGQEELRAMRKLVGWLISYSINPLGVDYKLFEGRNVIGHDIDCNITVNDKAMSGKHAVILFRAGKYKIKDELSSHGTYVNEEDIEEKTVEIHDGDIIKMGMTVFEFKAPASL